MINQCEKHVNLEKKILMKKIMNKKHRNCLEYMKKSLSVFFVPIFCYSFVASVCNRSNYVIHNM